MTNKEILANINGLNECVAEITRLGRGPTWAPYSFSSAHGCQLNFKFDKIDRLPRIQAIEGNTEEGSCVHETLELMVKNALGPQEAVNLAHVKHPTADYTTILDQAYLFEEAFEFTGGAQYTEWRYGLSLDMSPSDWDSDQTWWRGVIDLLEISGDKARIIDYKSFPRVDSLSQLRSSKHKIHQQLLTYAVGVFAHFPEVKTIELGVYYSSFGVMRMITQAGSAAALPFDRMHATDHWRALQTRMLSWERSDLDSVRPQPSASNCQYCQHAHQCPAMINREADSVTITSDEEARAMIDSILAKSELVHRQRKAIKAWVESRGTVENLGGARATFVNKMTPIVGVGIARKLAAELGFDVDSVLSVNKSDLLKAIASVGATPENVLEYDIKSTFSVK